MKVITITIKPGGDSTVAVTGITGAACLKATAEVEAAIGKTTQSTPTAEMRQTSQTLSAGQS